MAKHYGKETILLIDEYDVPLDKVFHGGYYTEMVSLICNLFGNTLLKAFCDALEEGKAEEVEQKMQAYLDNQVQNAMMYPMNVPKLKATQILRVDQYVFYVCLGAYDEDSLDETAAEQYYKEQVEIGVKAIHDTLGK